MHRTIIIFLITGAVASAQTTQPSQSALETRATQAFNRGEYVIALPLLQKLATELKDQPDRLGPVEEQIRVCRRNIEAKDPQARAAEALAARPPTAEERKPHAAPENGQTIDLAIKDLGNFEYDPANGGGIPDDVKALTGATLSTRGYMIPSDQADNVTEFALVPSLFACCFGQPPQVQHTIIVRCPKGKSVNYFPDEIIVTGTLKVEEKKDEGYVISLFEMETTSVKPAPK